MSQSRFYQGVIKELARGEEAEKLAESIWKKGKKGEKPGYHNTYVEAVADEFYKKYMHNNGVLYEHMHQVEYDLYEEIIEVKPSNNKLFAYTCKYYDGGGSLEECIQEGLDKLENEADH